MPPISSSRLAPCTSCSSPAASIWASQVRNSCLGALLKVRAGWSAGRFMALPFVLVEAGGGALERAARHGVNEIAPIVGAGVDILKRVDGGSGGCGGGLEHVGGWRAAVERGFCLGDPPRPGLSAANAQTRIRDGAILEPIA